MERNELLQELVNDILSVFHSLQYGSIDFSFDKLHCAMKSNICEDFDSVASSVVLKVEFGGEEVTDDDLQKLIEGLTAFKKEYKVKEVATIIKKAKAIIDINKE